MESSPILIFTIKVCKESTNYLKGSRLQSLELFGEICSMF